MAEAAATPEELEGDANRLRARMGATFGALRENMKPANLMDEAARGGGLRDASTASLVDFGVRRHPWPTMLVGVGLGLFAYSVVRARPSGAAGARNFLGDTASKLANSATDVFRQRAEQRRQAFIGAASAHIRTGASQLSDMLEKSVDGLAAKAPGGSAARPLVESALQIALLAAVEALLPKR